jgi:hypothetical protein
MTMQPHAVHCPSCGQVVLPERLRLPPIKQRILSAVQRRPGLSAEELRTIVWAHDPNGGPENPKCLHVHINQLNRLIAPMGFVVRASNKGAGAGYWIRATGG